MTPPQPSPRPAWRLVVFTRCPEPGRCKTRLIADLGEARATAVHEFLVRRTMSWMPQAMNAGVLVEVRYAGDDLESLRRLCGDAADRMNFRPQQHGGDLGQRLARAFSAAFLEGASRVAAIGTDCPQLTHSLVLKAFSALETSDVVLGPATDGGYYLIASRAFHPELFTDIGWGGNSVLADTLARANRSRLLVEILAPLADVDRPSDVEDLLREN